MVKRIFCILLIIKDLTFLLRFKKISTEQKRTYIKLYCKLIGLLRLIKYGVRFYSTVLLWKLICFVIINGIKHYNTQQLQHNNELMCILIIKLLLF